MLRTSALLVEGGAWTGSHENETYTGEAWRSPDDHEGLATHPLRVVTLEGIPKVGVVAKARGDYLTGRADVCYNAPKDGPRWEFTWRRERLSEDTIAGDGLDGPAAAGVNSAGRGSAIESSPIRRPTFSGLREAAELWCRGASRPTMRYSHVVSRDGLTGP